MGAWGGAARRWRLGRPRACVPLGLEGGGGEGWGRGPVGRENPPPTPAAHRRVAAEKAAELPTGGGALAGWRHPRRSLIGPNRQRHPSRVTSSGDGMTRRPGRSVGGRVWGARPTAALCRRAPSRWRASGALFFFECFLPDLRLWPRPACQASPSWHVLGGRAPRPPSPPTPSLHHIRSVDVVA